MLEDYKLENLVEPALTWFEKNKRDLPWRKDRNPYHIWVSEIMLQQTRVEAVKGYYERFLHRLPTIRDLAECPEDELLKLWEGLGYYNRVRNMQKAAKIIMEDYGGNMPKDYDAILALPGIGAYTAGAISSIAYGISAPAVDGNVLRILCRVSEDDSDIKKEGVKKKLTSLLFPIMPEKSPGDFNQALMEIGAIVCLPNGEPLCDKCPWGKMCQAKCHNSIDRYPVKSKAAKRRIEEKTVLLIMDGDKILIEKRPSKGLLAGLYQFPNLEGYLKRDDVISYVRKKGLDPIFTEPLPEAKHIFSHIEWRMKGYLVKVSDLELYQETVEEPPILIEKSKIQSEYAIPAAFEKYATYVNLTLGKKGFL
ncbi:MAG: A/G-specific adenine glycosylase [Lachnospiraceae bacterium]|nr:A/G-specific adenine glycosylase [Lachnospiraceae bacterium]